MSSLFELALQLNRSQWEHVSVEAHKLAASLFPLAQAALPCLPPGTTLWYAPETKHAHLQTRQSVSDELAEQLGQETLTVDPRPLDDPLMVRLASTHAAVCPPGQAESLEPFLGYLASTGLLEASAPLAKLASNLQGYSPTLRSLGEMAGYLPGGRFSWDLPNVPRHLQGMLGGGLLGGALGYGAGWLGSQLLPESWDKSKLRRNGFLAGAALGVAPGLLAMQAEHGTGIPHLADAVFDAPPPESATKASAYTEASALVDVELHPLLKQAISQTGVDEFGLDDVALPVDALNQTIWQDPRVSGPLTLPQQAALTGLLQAAQTQRETGTGQAAPWVYPSDVARIAAGMGSGYLSGAIVGKVLGGLAGAPESVQDRLKNMGLWAGVVQGVLPLVFGR